MLAPDIRIVPKWARTAEIVWLSVSALGGFFGVALLERFVLLLTRMLRSELSVNLSGFGSAAPLAAEAAASGVVWSASSC